VKADGKREWKKTKEEGKKNKDNMEARKKMTTKRNMEKSDTYNKDKKFSEELIAYFP
jgi:hypothetical protein